MCMYVCMQYVLYRGLIQDPQLLVLRRGKQTCSSTLVLFSMHILIGESTSGVCTPHPLIIKFLLRILHKAESTGCLLDSVEPHDDPLHLTAH